MGEQESKKMGINLGVGGGGLLAKKVGWKTRGLSMREGIARAKGAGECNDGGGESVPQVDPMRKYYCADSTYLRTVYSTTGRKILYEYRNIIGEDNSKIRNVTRDCPYSKTHNF